MNETYPDSFRAKVARDLEKRGVAVILDDRVDSFPDGFSGSFKTFKGKEISADLIVCSLLSSGVYDLTLVRR